MSSWLWGAVKAVLFRLDAERVHRLTAAAIRFASRFGHAPLRVVSGTRADVAGSPRPEVLGMSFRSRVGLAAGFDKDAELVAMLPDLGFGFAEIGTVTPLPQPGNERPRLMRDPGRQAIFNRMGFNGAGAAAVSAHLRAARPGLPADFRVGVNIGKNKVTPNEDAARDYIEAARAFEGLADYLVINVSSPNTPGLRALQSAQALRPIVEQVAQLITRWGRRPPLLLKLAPEVRGEDLAAILSEGPSWGIDGWVLTNTLGGPFTPAAQGSLWGGWSGGPLTERARASLREARAQTLLPIISVGGIMTAAEAAERIRCGADLVQLYSGWIYGGPGFPARVARALSGPRELRN